MHKCYAFDNICVWIRKADSFRSLRANKGILQARQAESCGFSPANFHRKLQVRKMGQRDFEAFIGSRIIHLQRARNLHFGHSGVLINKATLKGIWSHETALDIHGLSDVAPAKLHMSVPRSLGKIRQSPKISACTSLMKFSQSEIEIRQGYRVTTPLRTLADVIQEGQTQNEQIELAILDLAVQKSLIKGLATIQEMEQLQKFTGSKKCVKSLLEQSIMYGLRQMRN